MSFQNAFKAISEVGFHDTIIVILFRKYLICDISVQQTTEPVGALKILVQMTFKLVRWFKKSGAGIPIVMTEHFTACGVDSCHPEFTFCPCFVAVYGIQQQAECGCVMGAITIKPSNAVSQYGSIQGFEGMRVMRRFFFYAAVENKAAGRFDFIDKPECCLAQLGIFFHISYGIEGGAFFSHSYEGVFRGSFSISHFRRVHFNL